MLLYAVTERPMCCQHACQLTLHSGSTCLLLLLLESGLATAFPSDTFPFAVRLHVDLLASDGSEAMLALSTALLAMADAGVPLRDHVAGMHSISHAYRCFRYAHQGRIDHNLFTTAVSTWQGHRPTASMKVMVLFPLSEVTLQVCMPIHNCLKANHCFCMYDAKAVSDASWAFGDCCTGSWLITGPCACFLLQHSRIQTAHTGLNVQQRQLLETVPINQPKLTALWDTNSCRAHAAHCARQQTLGCCTVQLGQQQSLSYTVCKATN